MYERIIAGTDFSPTATRATNRAAWLAKTLDADLIVVHVGKDRSGALDELGDKYGAKTMVKEGSPPDVLIASADEAGADLIVIGNRGMSGPRRFMIGNVPNKISHHSPKDLLIVKTDKDAPREGYSKIVVGTDGSDTSMKAVEAGAKLAVELDASLIVACAFEPPTEHELEQLRADPNDPVAQWNAQSGQDVPEEFRWRVSAASQAEDILERAIDHASKTDGVKVEARAVEGHPVEALAQLVDEGDADLIVVGNVGMAGAKRFMLGNVPHRLSHHAPCDLLILRTS
jgi:nucleotide-binding universal stress UspA family protein